MVKHAGGGRSYWTLPGGHVEKGESYESAAVREVQEETGLEVVVERLLWEGEAGPFYEKCFLLGEAEKKSATLGKDPELGDDAQILKEVSWFQLKEMENDIASCESNRSHATEAVSLCGEPVRPDRVVVGHVVEKWPGRVENGIEMKIWKIRLQMVPKHV